MTTQANRTSREFGSGEVVEPGIYVDLETGSKIQVQERDELPEGVRVIHYTRRFRRLEMPEPAAA